LVLNLLTNLQSTIVGVPTPFTDCVFVFFEDTYEQGLTRKELADLVTQAGGVVEKALSDRTTHVVCSKVSNIIV
jgi:hypothetical protein